MIPWLEVIILLLKEIRLYILFLMIIYRHIRQAELAFKLEIHATAYAYGNSALASQNYFLVRLLFIIIKLLTVAIQITMMYLQLFGLMLIWVIMAMIILVVM